VEVDGVAVEPSQTVLFERSGETITVTARSDAKLLLLAGQPLDEPIAHYGPFVMNTQEEIRQAIDDFRRGKMGNL
jgi:redox-sensitive bicupin YhaK (pirin superfamily)